MPWNALTSLCRPTLHDRVLYTKIAALERVTPATVRAVARGIAAEGLAGEQAMDAAQIALAVDKSDRLTTNHHLLASVIRQVNVAPDSKTAALEAGTAELNARARQTIAWLAPHLRQPATWAVGALDAISIVMASIGVASSGDVGKIPRLMSMLRQTREGIAEFNQTLRREDQVTCARMICSMADLTLELAETELAKARAVTGDIVGLLRTWAADPETVIRLAERPEWLLDGWERICQIWSYAQDDASRHAALVEIGEQVPTLPREVSDWSGHTSDLDAPTLKHRMIKLNEDWRTGVAVFDLTARNEMFRATLS